MSVYKVHFKWKEKDIAIQAKNLDLTHPYFVSIKDLIIPTGSSLIINPEEDQIIKDFGNTDHIMIPIQTVTLIEENIEKETPKRNLSLMEENGETE